MKKQRYIVEIEMPDGDKISPTWLKDLIQSDCDVEDSGRQIVSVSEVIESQGLDEAAEKCAEELCSDWAYRLEYEAAFEAGAEWMAEQGIIADFEVNKLAVRAWLTAADEDKFQKDIYDNFEAGDKVIVQIRKK